MTNNIKSFHKNNWNVENTQSWLIKLWKSNNWMEQDADRLLQLLSCMIICVERKKDEHALGIIEEVCVYINNSFSKKIDESNPLIFTMTYRLLNKINKTPGKVFQNGALHVKESLKSVEENLMEDEKIFFLMDRYSLVTEEQTMHFVRRKIIDDTRFLLLSAEEMENQLYLWFLCTSLGKRKMLPSDLKKSSEKLKILFSGCLLAECQKYQLGLVSLLLRTMSYLSYESELLTEGANFLYFQQRSDGSFGYLNPLASSKNQLSENINMDYYLPTLYEVLEALSDITKNKSER